MTDPSAQTSDLSPLTLPPQVSWETLQRKIIAEWEPGEHVTLVGPTGCGKTHMALALASLCRYVIVLASKRKDPLLQEQALKGYHVTTDLDAMLWTEHGEPLKPKVLYWPRFPDRMSMQERVDAQAHLMRKALDWADKTSGWALVVDELMWFTNNLKLRNELEAVWFQGRTQGVSLIGAAQRPSHIPRLAYSQATYLILWKTGDKDDIDRLRDISSTIPREMIEQSVRQLDATSHECLFVDTKRSELVRVIAPARF